MQTVFPIDRIKTQVGQKVDATQAVVVSAVSNVQIPFGVLVLYDDSDTFLCKLPVPKTALDKPLGIRLRQLHCQHYEPQTSLTVMRKGRVWVMAEKVSAPGDAVFIKFTEDGSPKFTADKTSSALLRCRLPRV